MMAKGLLEPLTELSSCACVLTNSKGYVEAASTAPATLPANNDAPGEIFVRLAGVEEAAGVLAAGNKTVGGVAVVE